MMIQTAHNLRCGPFLSGRSPAFLSVWVGIAVAVVLCVERTEPSSFQQRAWSREAGIGLHIFICRLSMPAFLPFPCSLAALAGTWPGAPAS